MQISNKYAATRFDDTPGYRGTRRYQAQAADGSIWPARTTLAQAVADCEYDATARIFRKQGAAPAVEIKRRELDRGPAV